MQFFYLTLSATMVVILKNTPCSLNMTTSVQTRIMLILLVSWDGGTDKQSDAELVELLAQKVYELGIAVGIDMNWKGQGVTRNFFKTLPILWPNMLMKTNVQQLIRKEPLISELKEIIEIAFDYKGVSDRLK